MNKLEIKPLLGGIIARNSLNLVRVLEKEIKGLYAAFSKHHTMTAQAIASDATYMAKRLNETIKLDSRYSSLREAEIGYLFTQGVQGALGDRYKSLSLMMIFSWLAEYLNSGERRAALQEWAVQEARDMPSGGGQPAGGQLTEEQMWVWVERSYDSYCKQLDLKSRKMRSAFVSDKVPAAGKDYGGLQTRFLQERGYMFPGEKFYEFLERAIGNEGVFLPVADLPQV